MISSKEQTGPDCNATHLCDDENQVTIVQDCERRMPCHCNKLQDRFNALTGERDHLRNEKSDLTNRIRKLVEERDKLLRGQNKSSHLSFVQILLISFSLISLSF